MIKTSTCTATRRDGSACEGDATHGMYCFPHAHLGLEGKEKRDYYRVRRDDIVRRYTDQTDSGGSLARRYDIHLQRIHQILRKAKESEEPVPRPKYVAKIGAQSGVREFLLERLPESPLAKRKINAIRDMLESAQVDKTNLIFGTNNITLLVDLQSFVQYESLRCAVSDNPQMARMLELLAKSLFKLYTSKK